MGDGSKGEFEKKPKRDERRLSELVGLWFTMHGNTLKQGDKRRREMLTTVARIGDPMVCTFTAEMFADYRAARIAGKWGAAQNWVRQEERAGGQACRCQDVEPRTGAPAGHVQ